MGNIVYSNGSFRVYRVGNEYIVHNTHKRFKDGHTHLNNYNSAKYLIKLEMSKRVPRNLDTYRLISLTRITLDDDYKSKIKELIDIKKSKKCDSSMYFNVNKGVKKYKKR